MRDNKVYVSDVWRRGWAARLPDYPHLVNSMSVCARWSALVTMGASPSALAQTSMPTFVDTLACASTSAQMLVVHVVEALEHVLFFNVPFLQVPFIVLWLFTGALFFTVRMRFINVRGFRHAIELVRGKYDDPNEPGEITHFQALSSALAATVGLGNIAGVTIAVTAGGPGAIFWLVVAGLLGMTSKFTECTLAQMYRRIDEDGRVVGGPMVYLSEGLRDKGLPRLGRVLAVGFSLFCIGGAFGAGNMFQVNQAFAAVAQVVPAVRDYGLAFGLVLAALVGVVILGGITRIAGLASRLVPSMCALYILAATFVVLLHAGELPQVAVLIVTSAFAPDAAYGGVLGVLVIGVQRAAFSNEAGVGSAAIAHSAAKTRYPIREGLVASLGPFIDTVLVCTLTGLVIVITDAHQGEAFAGLNGAALTSAAFGSVLGWFPYALAAATVLFAYSTVVAWSYYGERCWVWLFGNSQVRVYRLSYCVAVACGAVFSLDAVLKLSDMMVLCMAFPNVLGLYLLSGKVRKALNEYWMLHRAP